MTRLRAGSARNEPIQGVGQSVFFSSLRFFVFEFLDVFSKFLTPDFFLISDVRFFSQFLMSDFFLISDVRFEGDSKFFKLYSDTR